MNIIIPMAGRGSRLVAEGYETPKPLIEICGCPMVFWALRSLRDLRAEAIAFVVLRAHQERYDVRSLVAKHVGDRGHVVVVDDVPPGQLGSVLRAKEWINPDSSVLIASSDTIIRSRIGEHLFERPTSSRGLISVIRAEGDRWSFAKVDSNAAVVDVAEKVRISDLASTGIYFFDSGEEFLRAADAVIMNQVKVRDEYYVMPVFKEYLRLGLRVDISIADWMLDMGTHEGLQTARKTFAEPDFWSA